MLSNHDENNFGNWKRAKLKNQISRLKVLVPQKTNFLTFKMLVFNVENPTYPARTTDMITNVSNNQLWKKDGAKFKWITVRSCWLLPFQWITILHHCIGKRAAVTWYLSLDCSRMLWRLIKSSSFFLFLFFELRIMDTFCFKGCQVLVVLFCFWGVSVPFQALKMYNLLQISSFFFVSLFFWKIFRISNTLKGVEF